MKNKIKKLNYYLFLLLAAFFFFQGKAQDNTQEIAKLIVYETNLLRLEKNLPKLKILDKTFLHLKHNSHKHVKFHLEIIIKSEELKIKNRRDVSRNIHKILQKEINESIHSLQIKLI